MSENWGPWQTGIGPCERLARLRSLQTLVHAFFGFDHPLWRALFWAETLLPDDLANALAELLRVPSRDQRKIVATYGAILAKRAQEAAREATRMGAAQTGQPQRRGRA